MNKLIKAFITFLVSSGYSLKKPKKEGSKGIIIYDTLSPSDLDKAHALASSIEGYSLIESDAEYEGRKCVKPAFLLFTPVSDNSLSEEDALAHILG